LLAADSADFPDFDEPWEREVVPDVPMRGLKVVEVATTIIRPLIEIFQDSPQLVPTEGHVVQRPKIVFGHREVIVQFSHGFGYGDLRCLYADHDACPLLRKPPIITFAIYEVKTQHQGNVKKIS
jgi:hypothetical protein